MEAREFHRSDKDWWRVWIDGGVFNGAGGALNLTDIANQFGRWATE